jgi:hypothetical protein
MAMGPDVEFKKPSLTESPLTQVETEPSLAVPPVAASSEPLLQPANSNADTATMPTTHLALPRLIRFTPPHVET